MSLYAYNFNIYLDNEISESMHFNYIISADNLSFAKMEFKEYVEKNEKIVTDFINKITIKILEINELKINDFKNDKKIIIIFNKYIKMINEMLKKEIYNCIEKIYKINTMIIGSMIIESDQGGGSFHHIVQENQISSQKENINKIIDLEKNKILMEPFQKIKKKFYEKLKIYKMS